MRALRGVDGGDEAVDESSDERDQRGFMQASQVRPEHIEKLDKEVNVDFHP